MNKHLLTTKQTITLALMVLALIGLWAILAFFLPENLIPRFSLWASLIFGTGSLIIAILALAISIHSFRNTELISIQKLEEDANKFIKDNNEEIQYLPLCLIANSYDNHHKFERKIYNEFNVLNRELQKEVLKQMCYEDYDVIIGKGWISKSLNLVKKFIQDNDLGRDLLYENAKYFHRSINYASFDFDGRTETEYIMPDLFGWNTKPLGKGRKKKVEKICFDSYLTSYLEAKAKNDVLYQSNKDKKPIDVLAAVINFSSASEDCVCCWMMQMVLSVAITMIYKQIGIENEEVVLLSRGDATAQTFEDRYLEVLMELYNLWIVSSRK